MSKKRGLGTSCGASGTPGLRLAQAPRQRHAAPVLAVPAWGAGVVALALAVRPLRAEEAVGAEQRREPGLLRLEGHAGRPGLAEEAAEVAGAEVVPRIGRRGVRGRGRHLG